MFSSLDTGDFYFFLFPGLLVSLLGEETGEVLDGGALLLDSECLLPLALALPLLHPGVYQVIHGAAPLPPRLGLTGPWTMTMAY